jgi:hypothetical protein
MSIAHRDVIATKGASDQVGWLAKPAVFGPLPGKPPWWVWVTPFAVMLTVLLVRNAFLFSTPEYESSDMGANSILIEQARRFTLLVGNYSRKGFNHPGPAFLYVESWGEQIFWAMLRVVPTAWNGQLIGLYILNAGFAACVVAVTYGWIRSVRGPGGRCARPSIPPQRAMGKTRATGKTTTTTWVSSGASSLRGGGPGCRSSSSARFSRCR